MVDWPDFPLWQLSKLSIIEATGCLTLNVLICGKIMKCRVKKSKTCHVRTQNLANNWIVVFIQIVYYVLYSCSSCRDGSRRFWKCSLLPLFPSETCYSYIWSSWETECLLNLPLEENRSYWWNPLLTLYKLVQCMHILSNFSTIWRLLCNWRGDENL